MATLYLNGRRYLLNRDGQIFAPAGRLDYGTRITTTGLEPSVAELKQNIEKTLEATRLLRPRKLEIREANFDASGCITLKLNNGLDLICLDRLTDKKAAMAVMAINRFGSTGKTVIDLTCEDKIVLRDRVKHGS
ncbi:MAG: Cell division protein FtsQ [Deltaproteobacteria bacterium ADurb.Bin510]|nr:MAG: Cell division protein FtsQ [Deltaproteobacteria bacterium ADurb.Bin510]